VAYIKYISAVGFLKTKGCESSAANFIRNFLTMNTAAEKRNTPIKREILYGIVNPKYPKYIPQTDAPNEAQKMFMKPGPRLWS